ncbi:LutC/YkgG family protein [Novispirillum itersonii]|uniref:L-lactate dehydrogenase complex protein LldG n=1 Tax=Novispirillum itersonii TaxID=189 RepID=A0A7W9ZDY1_NOVIT|nr:lactate utilization protein [Novispirillum itersonii]MBB6209738.1 L-lactate dehydrogenase complex protein LldG [Novispirillum itersonii]
MPSSRTAILESIRRSHGRGELSAERQQALRDRLHSHPAATIPARSDGDREARIALFTTMATSVDATVSRVAGWNALPQDIGDWLKARNLPTTLAVAPDARLDPVAQHPLYTVHRGPALPEDLIGVSVAEGGVAETGSLLMVSGPETPTSLNFLPDIHIVALPASLMVGPFEEAWARIRSRFPEGMPRTVNLITGPSRTGDIEQTLLLGAHGPRQLHIVIVDDATPA